MLLTRPYAAKLNRDTVELLTWDALEHMLTEELGDAARSWWFSRTSRRWSSATVPVRRRGRSRAWG